LYGSPNGGKTTLANRVCSDWLGETMGVVSSIAHETRSVALKESVFIKNKAGKSLKFSLVDTPGIASKIDYQDFVHQGLPEALAKQRAREATKGVVEAINWLSSMDVVLVVVDSSKAPDQVNSLLLENLKRRGIPVLMVANKVDLKRADPDAIRAAYPKHVVVAVSAKLGTNMDGLYEAMYSIAK